MNTGYRKDVESYIDQSIADTTERCLDWNITLYIFTDQLELALKAKWLRVRYLQGGH